ncbi:unnamed protein product [Closterium sp. Naga37s-1]|nr:unnamed protein product [Closterium sp. Naga37s-1]
MIRSRRVAATLSDESAAASDESAASGESAASDEDASGDESAPPLRVQQQRLAAAAAPYASVSVFPEVTTAPFPRIPPLSSLARFPSISETQSPSAQSPGSRSLASARADARSPRNPAQSRFHLSAQPQHGQWRPPLPAAAPPPPAGAAPGYVGSSGDRAVPAAYHPLAFSDTLQGSVPPAASTAAGAAAATRSDGSVARRVMELERAGMAERAAQEMVAPAVAAAAAAADRRPVVRAGCGDGGYCDGGGGEDGEEEEDEEDEEYEALDCSFAAWEGPQAVKQITPDKGRNVWEESESEAQAEDEPSSFTFQPVVSSTAVPAAAAAAPGAGGKAAGEPGRGSDGRAILKEERGSRGRVTAGGKFTGRELSPFRSSYAGRETSQFYPSSPPPPPAAARARASPRAAHLRPSSPLHRYPSGLDLGSGSSPLPPSSTPPPFSSPAFTSPFPSLSPTLSPTLSPSLSISLSLARALSSWAFMRTTVSLMSRTSHSASSREKSSRTHARSTVTSWPPSGSVKEERRLATCPSLCPSPRPSQHPSPCPTAHMHVGRHLVGGQDPPVPPQVEVTWVTCESDSKVTARPSFPCPVAHMHVGRHLVGGQDPPVPPQVVTQTPSLTGARTGCTGRARGHSTREHHAGRGKRARG